MFLKFKFIRNLYLFLKRKEMFNFLIKNKKKKLICIMLLHSYNNLEL